MPVLVEIRLRNETREITGALKGVCCPSSASSFHEDCARLKLSSARASQAGLKEMMMQTKNSAKGVEQQKDPPLLDFSMVGRATNVLVFGRS